MLETRFDTILPTLATKRDIEDLRREFSVGQERARAELEKFRGEILFEMEKLRAELFKAIHDAMKWTIGIVVTMFLGMLGANFAMLNAMKTRVESHPAAGPVMDPHFAPDTRAPRAAPHSKDLP